MIVILQLFLFLDKISIEYIINIICYKKLKNLFSIDKKVKKKTNFLN